jgi:hypothetical protein
MTNNRRKKQAKKPYIASDKEQVEEADLREGLIRDQELSDIAAIIGSEEGKRFINRFFNECNLYHEVFTGNSETFFNDGKRSMALWMIRDIQELARRGQISPGELLDCLLNLNTITEE